MQEQRAHVPSQPQPLRLPHVLTTQEKYLHILRRHLPAEAVDWVYQYADRHNLHLHVTRGRRSKLGDYRWPQPQHDFHEISVNGDLNPYFFFWVFLHEAAHLEVHAKYAEHVAPHGHEWQAEYAGLLRQHVGSFPADARDLVSRYASRIPLQRRLFRQVEAVLHRYDKGFDPDALLPRLDNLPAGTLFRLKSNPKILFRSVERRRTRWLCQAVGTARQYTVSGTAEVLVENEI